MWLVLHVTTNARAVFAARALFIPVFEQNWDVAFLLLLRRAGGESSPRRLPFKNPSVWWHVTGRRNALVLPGNPVMTCVTMTSMSSMMSLVLVLLLMMMMVMLCHGYGIRFLCFLCRGWIIIKYKLLSRRSFSLSWSRSWLASVGLSWVNF